MNPILKRLIFTFLAYAGVNIGVGLLAQSLATVLVCSVPFGLIFIVALVYYVLPSESKLALNVQ